jgi:hypothetical protein
MSSHIKKPLPKRGSQFSHQMRGIQQAAQISSGVTRVKNVKMRVCFCQPPSTERIRKSHLRLYANLDQSEFDNTSHSPFRNIRVTTPFCSTPTDNGHCQVSPFCHSTSGKFTVHSLKELCQRRSSSVIICLGQIPSDQSAFGYAQ